ncbi:hypothetical protein EPUL_001091 [Erysiphe pulchra]|uniref:Uncharacterized protein n=1 Tax=Erysiphe pulchra TaxID=225359 RepID=A0A2S4Q1I9_9PEZI|nr:hypothetical protein EPUL_001091 [Erysiphe pulchra]
MAHLVVIVLTDGPERKTRPVQRKDESYDDYLVRLELFDDKNDAAHSTLLNGVDQDFQELVCSCGEEPESARVAIRLLTDKYDYETTTPTIELFKEFGELKMAEGEIISKHISRFETSYAHIYSCCANSRPEALALRSFFAVEQELKYAEVNVRLIEMGTRQQNDTSNTSTAYFGNSNSVKEKGIKECTYCKKNGDNYIGHVFNNCRKLQKYKNKEKEKERFYDNANIAATSHEILPEIISSETTFVKAFAVPNSTSSDWILDSGCSAHMTLRQDLPHSLNPH